MKFIKIINGIPESYSIEKLYIDHPNAIIYSISSLPDENLLKKYNVYPLVTVNKPLGDVVIEGVPVFKDGQWYQTWLSRDFTNEEKSKIISNENNLLEPDEIITKRLEICMSCEYFDNTLSICKKCSCMIRDKIKFKSSFCPINKWQLEIK